jgi:hypothetical protein
MKKMIALALTCALTVPACAANTYSDSTYQAACEKAAADGYVIDALGSDFTKDITREQFCKLVINLVETRSGYTMPDELDNPFTDTDDPDVLKAYVAGLTNGTSDTTFSPDQTLTRQELATLLSRVLGKMGVTAEKADMSAYTDWEQVESWAQDAVAKLSALHIMQGTSATTLEPNAPCTIEQSVLLAARVAAVELPEGVEEFNPAEWGELPVDWAETPATAEDTDEEMTPADWIDGDGTYDRVEGEEMALAFTLENREALGSIVDFSVFPVDEGDGIAILSAPVQEGESRAIDELVLQADYVDISILFEHSETWIEGIPADFDQFIIQDGGVSILKNGAYVTTQHGAVCDAKTFKITLNDYDFT